MNESRIILPTHDNAGASLSAIHAWLEQRLVALFGGFTATAGRGGWCNPANGEVCAEPVTVYEVANDGGAAAGATLRTLAEQLAQSARQDAIYLRHAGSVSFIEGAAPAQVRAA